MKRRGFFGLPLAAFFATSGAAAAAGGALPGAPVKALYAGLLRIMKAGKSTSFATRFGWLAPVVESNFDLSRILRLAVGLRWNGLPEAQKKRLRTLFRDYTVASYVANFNGYDGEKLVVASGARAVGTERVVRTDIIGSDGRKNRIDYVVTPSGGGWQVVDVLLDGTISQLAVQRSEYSSLVKTGNASHLIAALAAKITQLSGGAVSG